MNAVAAMIGQAKAVREGEERVREGGRGWERPLINVGVGVLYDNYCCLFYSCCCFHCVVAFYS